MLSLTLSVVIIYKSQVTFVQIHSDGVLPEKILSFEAIWLIY